MGLCLAFSPDDDDDDDDPTPPPSVEAAAAAAVRDSNLLRIESSLESGVSLTMKSSHA